MGLVRAIAVCTLSAMPLLFVGAEQVADDTIPMVQRMVQPHSDVTNDTVNPEDFSFPENITIRRGNFSLVDMVGRVLRENGVLAQLEKPCPVDNKTGMLVKSDPACWSKKEDRKATITFTRKTDFSLTNRGTMNRVWPPCYFGWGTSKCKVNMDRDSEMPPRLKFQSIPAFGENAMFRARTVVSSKGWLPVSFSVECKMCGEPCKFNLMGRDLTVEMPSCPLWCWETEFDIKEWGKPKGLTVDMRVKHFRTSEMKDPVFTFDLMTEFPEE